MNLINLNNKLVVPSSYFSLSSTEEGEFEFFKSRCYGLSLECIRMTVATVFLKILVNPIEQIIHSLHNINWLHSPSASYISNIQLSLQSQPLHACSMNQALMHFKCGSSWTEHIKKQIIQNKRIQIQMVQDELAAVCLRLRVELDWVEEKLASQWAEALDDYYRQTQIQIQSKYK